MKRSSQLTLLTGLKILFSLVIALQITATAAASLSSGLHDPKLINDGILGSVIEEKSMAEMSGVDYPPRADAVYFGERADALDDNEWEIVFRRASALKDDRGGRIVLIGYLEGSSIDSIEIATVNRRLETITTFLKKSGVHEKQISRRVHYEVGNTVSCATETCRASYRRVDLKLEVPNRKRIKKR